MHFVWSSGVQGVERTMPQRATTVLLPRGACAIRRTHRPRCSQHSVGSTLSHRKRVVQRARAARAKYLQGTASSSRLLSSLARLRSCGTAWDDVETSREVLRAPQDVRHVRMGSGVITDAPATVLHACARLDGQHRLQKPTSHGGLAWLAGPSLQAHLQSAAISQRL